jgi:hypothetical protein
MKLLPAGERLVHQPCKHATGSSTSKGPILFGNALRLPGGNVDVNTAIHIQLHTRILADAIFLACDRGSLRQACLPRRQRPTLMKPLSPVQTYPNTSFTTREPNLGYFRLLPKEFLPARSSRLQTCSGNFFNLPVDFDRSHRFHPGEQTLPHSGTLLSGCGSTSGRPFPLHELHGFEIDGVTGHP